GRARLGMRGCRVFFQAEDGIRDGHVTGVQTCALPILAGLPVPEVLISAEDTPHGKPDPSGYRLAAERLRVSAADCLAVEDSPAGARAARDAGMHVLGVTNTHHESGWRNAHAVIASLAEIDVGLEPA